MAPRLHFGGFSSRRWPRPPKWIQDFILEALQATGGRGHTNGSTASFRRLLGSQTDQTAQAAARLQFRVFSGHGRPGPPKRLQGFSLLHALTFLLTYLLAYLLTYLLTYVLNHFSPIDLFTCLLTYLHVLTKSRTYFARASSLLIPASSKIPNAKPFHSKA